MEAKKHFIGDMMHTVYSGDDIPSEAGENAIFEVHEDSHLYAVLQIQYGRCDVMGMCYREHPESPLVARIRLRENGRKTAYHLEAPTVPRVVDCFNDMVEEFKKDKDFVAGHVLTPTKNRGRYAAFCRMLQCEPLDKELETSDDEENSS
jgi:hypothetical protein